MFNKCLIKSIFISSLFCSVLLAQQNHPRLLIGPDEIDNIYLKTQNPSNTICHYLYNNRLRPLVLDWKNDTHPGYDFNNYAKYLNVAFVALIENNEDWKNRMINLALNFSTNFGFPTQEEIEEMDPVEGWGDWWYNASCFLYASSIIFDYCYDCLEISEKDQLIQRIRMGLDELQPTVHNDDGLLYRLGSQHKVDAAYFMGGLAIAGETLSSGQTIYSWEEFGDDWNIINTNQFNENYGLFKYMWGNEGVCLDGAGYFGINLGRQFLFLQAVSHHFGTDYFNHPVVQETLGKTTQWLCSALFPNRDGWDFAFNQLNCSGSGGDAIYYNLLVLAEKYQDGKARWLFDQLYGFPPVLPSSNYLRPEVFIPSILIYNEFPAEAPDPQNFRSFLDTKRGLLYWRTGWDYEDLCFSFESTPVYHFDEIVIRKMQADKGSITLTAYGNNLIYDPGGTGGASDYNWQHDETWGNNYICVDYVDATVTVPGHSKGESNCGGNGQYFCTGEITDYEEYDFFNFASTYNKGAFDTLFGRLPDNLEIYPPGYDPGLPKYNNPVEKAQRGIFYLKETSKLPYYFWILDEIQKGNELYDYDWHICTKTTNDIIFDSNPIIITDGVSSLDVFVVYPESGDYTADTSHVDPVYPTANTTAAGRLSIFQHSVIGNYDILLIPYKLNFFPRDYSLLQMTSGDGAVINWQIGYEDCLFNSMNDDIQGPIINSDAEQVFLRKNINSDKLVHGFMQNGSHVTDAYSGQMLIDLNGGIGKVINDSITVRVLGEDIDNIVVMAPYATQLLVNDISIPFYRNGDYIQADQPYLWAIQNKSTSNQATFSNNSRQLAKSSGKLHEVFESDGEIYYRRSPDNGLSWTITRKLSQDNGSNKLQCITTSTSNMVHVVWQRQISSNTYEVWYVRSQNNGENWDSPIILPGASNIVVSSYQRYGVMPVITSLEYVPPSGKKLMVVYCSSSGLKYQYSENYGSAWSSPSTLSGYLNHRVWFPSMVAGSDFITLTYDYRGPGVFSRIYDGSSWSSETQVSGTLGTIQDRHSSVAIDDEWSGILAAWCAQRSGDPNWRLVFRYGYVNNTWSDWAVEFPEIPGQLPSITLSRRTGPHPFGIVITYYTPNHEVRYKKYNLNNGVWSDYLLDENGAFAGITHERESTEYPVMCWTTQTGSPYTVKLFSEGYSESLQEGGTIFTSEGITNRRAVISNKKDQSQFSLEIGDIYLTTSQGDKVTVYFPSYDYRKKLNLNLNNIWDCLQTESIDFSSDIKEISFKKNFEFITVDDSSGTKGTTSFTDVHFSLQIIDSVSQKVLMILDEDLSNGKKSVNLNQKISGKVYLKPVATINNVKLADLNLGLVDVVIPEMKTSFKKISDHQAGSLIPGNYRLEQTYPNPFNSSTTIKYSIPQISQVKMNIYNVLGEKIKTLLNSDIGPGEYKIIWNARDDMGKEVGSGIYFIIFDASSQIDNRNYMDVRKTIYLK